MYQMYQKYPRKMYQKYPMFLKYQKYLLKYLVIICMCLNFTSCTRSTQCSSSTTHTTYYFINFAEDLPSVPHNGAGDLLTKHYNMEKKLNIQSTVVPEDQPSQEEWRERYHAGDRLKSEISATTHAPLETYLKYIENQFTLQQNLKFN